MPLVLTKFGFTHEINSFQRQAPDGTVRTFWMSQGTGGRYNTINYSFSYKVPEGEDTSKPLYLRAHLIIFQDKYWESIGHGKSVLNGVNTLKTKSLLVKAEDDAIDSLAKLDQQSMRGASEVKKPVTLSNKPKANHGQTVPLTNKVNEVAKEVAENGKPLWQQLDKVNLKSQVSSDGDLVGRHKLITLCNTPTSKLRLYPKGESHNEFIGSVSLRIEATSSKYFSCDLGVRFGVDREIHEGHMESIEGSECLTPRMCIITKIKLDKNARTAIKLREVLFPLREHGAFQSTTRLKEVSDIARKIVSRCEKLLTSDGLSVQGSPKRKSKVSGNPPRAEKASTHTRPNKPSKRPRKHQNKKQKLSSSSAEAHSRLQHQVQGGGTADTRMTMALARAAEMYSAPTYHDISQFPTMARASLPQVVQPGVAGTAVSTQSASTDQVGGAGTALNRSGTLFPTTRQPTLPLSYVLNQPIASTAPGMMSVTPSTAMVATGSSPGKSSSQDTVASEQSVQDPDTFALFRMQSLLRDRTFLHSRELQNQALQKKQAASESPGNAAATQARLDEPSSQPPLIPSYNPLPQSSPGHFPPQRSSTLDSLALDSLASAAAVKFESSLSEASGNLSQQSHDLPLVSNGTLGSTCSSLTSKSRFTLSPEMDDFPLSPTDSLKFLSNVVEMEGRSKASKAEKK